MQIVYEGSDGDGQYAPLVLVHESEDEEEQCVSTGRKLRMSTASTWGTIDPYEDNTELRVESLRNIVSPELTYCTALLYNRNYYST